MIMHSRFSHEHFTTDHVPVAANVPASEHLAVRIVRGSGDIVGSLAMVACP
jgi:hypothetical protein